MTRAESAISKFVWKPQPEAAAFVHAEVDRFLAANAAARGLATRMRDETGTRFVDWIDHFGVPRTADLERQLGRLGFAPSADDADAPRIHRDGLFPTLMLLDSPNQRCAIKVESVSDFLVANKLDDRTPILGGPQSTVRKAMISRQKDTELWVVERHGDATSWEVEDIAPERAVAVLAQREAFRHRRRDFERDAEGFEHAADLVRTAAREVGVDRTCDLFFSAEREYWLGRNRAASIQKDRQDHLGLGWANHDHHTYRSSREHFAELVSVFEQLGCQCRERFYAGGQAGWGAQVLQHSACGIVIFADVDMTPDEVSGDFAHAGLEAARELGTVGLWCRLHGEAFLQAGMHHLECQFDFDRARQQLAGCGVHTMAPFTDFPYLKQAFTEGELWPVNSARIEAAAAEGLITPAQAKQFSEQGALGSHLEILQRDDGYQGFNQTGISEIILKTDPRLQG